MGKVRIIGDNLGYQGTCGGVRLYPLLVIKCIRGLLWA